MDRIHVKRNYYRGASATKAAKAMEENEIAEKVESYLNQRREQMTSDAIVIDYHDLARAIRRNLELVRRVASRIYGGHNAITLTRPPRL